MRLEKRAGAAATRTQATSERGWAKGVTVNAGRRWVRDEEASSHAPREVELGRRVARGLRPPAQRARVEGGPALGTFHAEAEAAPRPDSLLARRARAADRLARRRVVRQTEGVDRRVSHRQFQIVAADDFRAGPNALREEPTELNHDHFIVPPHKKIRLKDYDPADTGKFKDKGEAAEKLSNDIQRLAELQDTLYADNTYALLVIFQAMDAAGKDGTIRHVMSGVNPQGTQVYSFKGPSSEELDHDYLWRSFKALPERGRIGIFNRSYYEEVLIVRVHPQILDGQQLPPEAKKKGVWKHRFEEINDFERYLVRNGVHV